MSASARTTLTALHMDLFSLRIHRCHVFMLAIMTISSVANAQTTENGRKGRTVIESQLTARGPQGPLVGTLTLPGDGTAEISANIPVILIVPGSGPTDRDGNSPIGISAAPYKLLAESLTERGFPVLRFDKRGMFDSADAVANPNDVTITQYGDDLLAWVETIQKQLPTDEGARCVVPIGHSEGGIVALAAMDRIPEACGLVLVATPGRPMSDIMRAQLRANPANAPLLKQAEAAITRLEEGNRFDDAALDPALQPLFASAVQGFLIDAFRYDPAHLAQRVSVPVLVVQGTRDLQVDEEDAKTIAQNAPDAELALIQAANHVLKRVGSDDPATNLATYTAETLPIEPAITDVIVRFLGRLNQ